MFTAETPATLTRRGKEGGEGWGNLVSRKLATSFRCKCRSLQSHLVLHQSKVLIKAAVEKDESGSGGGGEQERRLTESGTESLDVAEVPGNVLKSYEKKMKLTHI